MSPVKCLCVSFAFKSELQSLTQTQRGGSKLCFLGGCFFWFFFVCLFLLLVLLKACVFVAGHWGEHQIKSALHTVGFFLPYLAADGF